MHVEDNDIDRNDDDVDVDSDFDSDSDSDSDVDSDFDFDSDFDTTLCASGKGLWIGKVRSPLLRWLCLLVLAMLAVVAPARAAGSLPAAGEYAVDATASAVTFNVTNFVVTSVDGKFNAFEGRVVVGDSLATSSVEASVDVASIDTGNRQRDDHLRTSDYFDVARFPRMTWKSSQLWGTPESFGMKGALTIKGITKEVVFAGRISDAGVFVAETKIDRQNFGITAGPSIKNEVRLRLQIRIAKKG